VLYSVFCIFGFFFLPLSYIPINVRAFAIAVFSFYHISCVYLVFFNSPLSREIDYIYVCDIDKLIHTYHSRMSDNFSCRVIIVGGGIIGLTTACTLLKEYASIDNLRLTIISETFSPDTTGDVSAGFWEPYGLNLNDQRIMDWARYTYNIFMAEFFSTKAARAGVMKLPGYILKSQDGQESSDKDSFTDQPFLPLVRHYRVLSNPEIGMFDHLGPATGFVMSSVVTEVRRYLPQLHRFLEQDPRVKFIKKKISSLSELKDEADVVINCTGLGARNLVGDLTVRPARGQVRSAFYFCFY
jgi:D-amino-acid oxidase